MLSSIGRNERGRGRGRGAGAGGGNWNDSDCRWRKSVGDDICNRRTDDDDLEPLLFLTALLSRLTSFRNRVLSLSLSLSCSSVFSYVFSLDHSGSADGCGMMAGWSRKTTIFLSMPAEFNTRLGTSP